MILIRYKDIKKGIKRLAKQIIADYGESIYELVLLVVLKAGFVFASDLIRYLPACVKVEFAELSTYKKKDAEIGYIPDLANKNVLVVDTICDSGKTLRYLADSLYKAKRLKTCVLLKKDKEFCNIFPDFFAFTIPDVFVYGYGLDNSQRMRGLKHIYRADGWEVEDEYPES